MKNQINRLKEFHKAFGLPHGNPLGECSAEQQRLHYTLMLEELNEFQQGCIKNDIVEIADGLADVLFVLLSSVVAHGLQDCFVDIFEEVCASNMSKLGKDGEPVRREDGKILRGEDYFRPDIAGIIKSHLEYKLLNPDKWYHAVVVEDMSTNFVAGVNVRLQPVHDGFSMYDVDGGRESIFRADEFKKVKIISQ